MAEARDGTAMTRTQSRVACLSVGLALVQLAAAGQGGSDLTKLTVPASQLPASCRLIPGPRGFLKTNPAVVTDAEQLGFIHSLLFAGTRSAAAADLRARGAQVAVGYAAAYEEKGGSHEIGVYALRMKDPAGAKAARASMAAARVLSLTKGSVAIFSWMDILPGQKDLGCFDVIKRHIEGVPLK